MKLYKICDWMRKKNAFESEIDLTEFNDKMSIKLAIISVFFISFWKRSQELKFMLRSLSPTHNRIKPDRNNRT